MGLNKIEFDLDKKASLLFSIEECLEDAKELKNEKLHEIIKNLDLKTLKILAKELILSNKDYKEIYRFDGESNNDGYNALILRNCGHFISLLTIARI